MTLDSEMSERSARRQAGQGLTELVIVLPVLLILVAGLLDLGRLYFAYVAVTDASAEGATYGAIHGAEEAGDVVAIKARARDATGGSVNIGADQIEVTQTGDSVRVTVTYSFTLQTPLINAIVPGGVIPLRAVTDEAVLEGAID